jgi:type VI secretion system protein ImpC
MKQQTPVPVMPRVSITYEVATESGVTSRELPFVIGVLGDFSGRSDHRPPFRKQSLLKIDLANFDSVLASLQPRVRFRILHPETFTELEIDLTFGSLGDFGPERLVERIEEFRVLRESGSEDDRMALRRWLDLALHAREFQALEAAWRGLYYLASRVKTDSTLKIKLIDVTKEELAQDMRRAPHPFQSYLFQKVFAETWGLSGEPFGLLIGNFTFSHGPEDVELLSSIAQVAAFWTTAFVADADSRMFGVDSYQKLSAVRSLGKTFEGAEYAPWNGFRQTEASQYVGLALPRILLRPPWSIPSGDEFEFEEDKGEEPNLLWGNAAYALGACIGSAFSRYGWCSPFRGAVGGGLVEGLPTTFVSDLARDGREVRSGVESLLAERHPKELSDLGFIPLEQYNGADFAMFFVAQTCLKPRIYLDGAANANSRLSTQLQYILTGSRFMHYLRATLESTKFTSGATYERILNDWVAQYCQKEDMSSLEAEARRPLRQARVEVADVPGRPGVYQVVAFLLPSFQLDELSAPLRFVTDVIVHPLRQ